MSRLISGRALTTFWMVVGASIASAAGMFNTIHTFTGSPDGYQPFAGVTIGRGGVLYGTTLYGGTSTLCYLGCGAVYSFQPPSVPGGAWTESVGSLPTPATGDMPFAGLLVGDRGVLYGAAYSGGECGSRKPGYGTIFDLVPPSSPKEQWTSRVLFNFCGKAGEGTAPRGTLVSDGRTLYGATPLTTLGGGPVTQGTVFKLSPPTSPGGLWTETTLYEFAGGADGDNPLVGVTIGGELNGQPVLYGVTNNGGIMTGPACNSGGCGTVFSLTPPAAPGGPWIKTTLHEFIGSDGAFPQAALTIGPNGVLYGTTWGCCSGAETVFSLTPPSSAGGTWTFAVIYTLNEGPTGSVVIGPQGRLYGATAGGGKFLCGTVFSLTPPASAAQPWTENVLYNFAGTGDGCYPNGIVPGPDGTFYGATRYNQFGAGGPGTVFSFKP